MSTPGDSVGTPAQLRDPEYLPPWTTAIPLGVQHVLAMFVANVTPALIVAGAAGFAAGSGSPDVSEAVYLIQISILFAGLATLLQTVGIGPIGARLPIVQGTSFAFVPIMIPLVAGRGVDAMAAVTGGVIVGGLVHALAGTVIGRLRFALPPLVTGLVVLMIGLALVRVGIQYAAGGAALAGTPEYGSVRSWALAGTVVVVTLGVKFVLGGLWSAGAVLVGLAAGYVLALLLGTVDFAGIDTAALVAVPDPVHFGIEFTAAAVIGFTAMALISAIETVGDVSGITKAGAGRDATDAEITGATYADGLGSAVAGVFGGLPNTSFSQNVGLIAMTRVMSRHVVSIGAAVLIVCGLVPKVGAAIATVPIQVLGGGVIVMFGMVAAAGLAILSDVVWTQRNMLIFAVALSIGFGLQLEPAALQQLPETPRVLLATGLLPAAAIAVVLNLVVPDRIPSEVVEEE